MPRLRRWLLLLIAPLMALPTVLGLAAETMTTPNVVHVLGLENVKHNAKGKLTIQTGTLGFAAGQAKAAVPVTSILDVFTGEDSKRLIGGTIGTLTMFAPYGSGRFLSLFREKEDTLTVEYRDAKGGLHGVLFMLPQGQAAKVKQELVNEGVRVSIPVEEEMKQPKSKKEEKKP